MSEMNNQGGYCGVAIIGLDHWYWAYGCAYAVAVHPQASLIGIADRDGERVKKMAELYRAKNWETDYNTLLRNPEVDAVIITSTMDLHPEIVKDAADAGKDILVGKPIARTLQEADQIIEAVDKAGVKLRCLDTKARKGDPVRSWIDSGVIGKPYMAHCSVLAIPPIRAPGVKEPGWFADPYKCTGGGFIDHAIYQIADLRWYFGQEVKRVYAEMGRFVLKSWAIEDHGIALVKFKDGAVATLEASNTAPRQTHSRTLLIGTEGEIEIRGQTISIWSKKEEYKYRQTLELIPPPSIYETTYAKIPVPTPPYAEGFKPVVDEFIECVIDDTEPMVTAEDARANLEVCLAAYESVRVKKPVTLPLQKEVDVPSILERL